MDVATVVTAVTSSLGISAATAAWLSRTVIGHQLKKDFAVFKSRLDQERAGEQAAVQGKIRQQVETALAELASERQYAFDAKKRLYTAIGPLRFQLLLACRDLAGRIEGRGLVKPYDMSLRGYYGRSTLFRILRPLCLGELVERQVAYADFSIDEGAIELLRFKKNAFAVFSGGNLVEGHPKVNWNDQVQHVYFDSLGRCANMMIVRDDGGQERALRFHEFDLVVSGRESGAQFEPFPDILHGLTPEAKPLFWLRLVGYGYLCNDFINRTGLTVGFERREYPVRELLSVTRDSIIQKNLDEYERRCRAAPDGPM